jgi:hypothetical protein
MPVWQHYAGHYVGNNRTFNNRLQNELNKHPNTNLDKIARKVARNMLEEKYYRSRENRRRGMRWIVGGDTYHMLGGPKAAFVASQVNISKYNRAIENLNYENRQIARREEALKRLGRYRGSSRILLKLRKLRMAIRRKIAYIRYKAKRDILMAYSRKTNTGSRYLASGVMRAHGLFNRPRSYLATRGKNANQLRSLLEN